MNLFRKHWFQHHFLDRFYSKFQFGIFIIVFSYFVITLERQSWRLPLSICSLFLWNLLYFSTLFDSMPLSHVPEFLWRKIAIATTTLYTYRFLSRLVSWVCNSQSAASTWQYFINTRKFCYSLGSFSLEVKKVWDFKNSSPLYVMLLHMAIAIVYGYILNARTAVSGWQWPKAKAS